MLKFQREILNEFRPIGKEAKIILFGSLARGTYRLDSDIDLAIISDEKKLKIMAEKIADRVLAKYSKVVSIKFISASDLKKRDPFIKEVLNGRVIYGGG